MKYSAQSQMVTLSAQRVAYGSMPLEPAETRPRSTFPELRVSFSKVRSAKPNTDETILMPDTDYCHYFGETALKVEWYPIYGPKSLFKFGEKRPIVCYCTREQKINFEGFTQNGCYGNQPQPFEVVFYSIDANTSCSFTKQDLTVKQAYRASFCFVLCNEPKFW